MATADRYLQRPIECMRAADAATEPGRKLVLLEIAERWLKFAAQVEYVDDSQSSLYGDALLPTAKPRPPTH